MAGAMQAHEIGHLIELARSLFHCRILLDLLPESFLRRREPDVVQQYHVLLRRGLDALNLLVK